jgi:hypothetical protein
MMCDWADETRTDALGRFHVTSVFSGALTGSSKSRRKRPRSALTPPAVIA